MKKRSRSDLWHIRGARSVLARLEMPTTANPAPDDRNHSWPSSPQEALHHIYPRYSRVACTADMGNNPAFSFPQKACMQAWLKCETRPCSTTLVSTSVRTITCDTSNTTVGTPSVLRDLSGSPNSNAGKRRNGENACNSVLG